ncbi:MAG: hypothetical protein U5L04_01655 [Trueperaceae bacterium]|nr:hypothetical protein [Trueperaceae bacterium]
MADMPTHSELMSEVEAQVLGDPDTNLNDFSTGSALYTFATVAATAGRASMRWFSGKLRTVFLSLASGSDLDYIVEDRFGSDGPKRKTGESDEAFLTRVYAYVDSLIRGTGNAFEFWLLEYDGRAAAVEIDEDLGTGVTDIIVTPDDTVANTSAYIDELRAELDKWRTLNGRVNVVEAT